LPLAAARLVSTSHARTLLNLLSLYASVMLSGAPVVATAPAMPRSIGKLKQGGRSETYKDRGMKEMKEQKSQSLQMRALSVGCVFLFSHFVFVLLPLLLLLTR